ncbi:polysaccharide deacetylase family protein [Aureibacillus halotolerans]|uniref:Polysaccharide deacetylase family sporulation protein PdaB n=1 Tax=Aureibacillus halotolerans TaxID=1508390 RepID=A0A4R6TTA5_9BACI|nr:polysaccharide deacetylase family protein [Aureibacillus halotolerans]TDQ34751.1 polysaccharide deacetylase family sporulation protein PdaB [Aureibacillus halotolerans]
MFHVVHAKSLKAITFIAILAFFCAWFLMTQYSSTAALFASTDQVDAAIYHGPSDKNRVALTFNITWGDERAKPIVDFLKKEGITATFFMTGEWAEKHPDLVSEMVKDGHDIGSLGYMYKSYVDMKPGEMRSDLQRADGVFAKLNVEDVHFFRPPNGHLSKEMLDTIQDTGYQTIHWSLNSQDWKNPGEASILAELEETSNGDILLLHASDSAQQTLDVMPDILDMLEKKELVPVTLSALLDDMTLDTKEVH